MLLERRHAALARPFRPLGSLQERGFEGGRRTIRFSFAVAVTGIVLNVTGWAGNVFLLGSMWDRADALAPPPMRSPFSPPVHAILQFASDFVFAFVLCAACSPSPP
ncbi:MAG TPA: hypothetical protein VE964_05300 [Myxococcales bacterium]|nr:hypothetical protein [Myxococcales bacterium]